MLPSLHDFKRLALDAHHAIDPRYLPREDFFLEQARVFWRRLEARESTDAQDRAAVLSAGCFVWTRTLRFCLGAWNPLDVLLGLEVMRRASLGLQVEEAVAPLAKVRRLGLTVLVTPVKVRGRVVLRVASAVLAVAGLEKLQHLAGRRGGQSRLSLAAHPLGIAPRAPVRPSPPSAPLSASPPAFRTIPTVNHQEERERARTIKPEELRTLTSKSSNACSSDTAAPSALPSPPPKPHAPPSLAPSQPPPLQSLPPPPLPPLAMSLSPVRLRLFVVTPGYFIEGESPTRQFLRSTKSDGRGNLQHKIWIRHFKVCKKGRGDEDAEANAAAGCDARRGKQAGA